MGVQVSHHIHPEIPKEGNIRENENISRADTARSVQSKGDSSAGRARDERSCALMFEHSAEIQCGVYDRIPEREECSKNPSGIAS